MIAAAFFSRDPDAFDPWRIVTHVLTVAAIQFRNPIVVLIQMESGDPSRNSGCFFFHAFCSVRFGLRDFSLEIKHAP